MSFLTGPTDRGVYADTNATAQSTIVKAVTGTIAAGQVVIVRVCTTHDVNISGGATNYHSSVADTHGNTYTKLVEYTAGGNDFGGNPTASLWLCNVTTEIPSGDSITATLASGRKGRVLMITEFSSGGLSAASESAAGVTATSTAPGPVSISGLASADYTWIATGLISTDVSNTLTGDADFTTDQPKNGTSGGGTYRSACTMGEYRATTATSESWEAASGTSDYNVALLAAIKLTAGECSGTGTGAAAWAGSGAAEITDPAAGASGTGAVIWAGSGAGLVGILASGGGAFPWGAAGAGILERYATGGGAFLFSSSGAGLVSLGVAGDNRTGFRFP